MSINFKMILVCCCLLSLLACTDDKTITEPTLEGEQKPDPDPDPTDDPMGHHDPRPYNSNRLFIKHGLQLHCWISGDDISATTTGRGWNYSLNANDWRSSGFTGPTFFGPPLFNPTFFRDFPKSQWSIAKAPYGTHMLHDVKRTPNRGELRDGFLKSEQESHLSKLTAICFGDEEYYDPRLEEWLKGWYSLARYHYPDALVHNNQYPTQWDKEHVNLNELSQGTHVTGDGKSRLSSYIRVAKPDLITYDRYQYHGTVWNGRDYIASQEMVRNLMYYRDLALEGLDGSGAQYIAFGQFTQGIVQNFHPTPGLKDRWEITEAQMRTYYYMTWTLGGKWLNWFRYAQAAENEAGSPMYPEDDNSLLLVDGRPTQHTKHMARVNLCNQESKRIGDCLVRLLTTDVYFVTGSSGSEYTDTETGWIADNMNTYPQDGNLPVSKLSAKIKSNPDKSGDVFIGYYKIIPKSEEGDPTFFNKWSAQDAQFFMINNSYCDRRVDIAADLSQIVTIEVDLTKELFWINPRPEPMTLDVVPEKLFPISTLDGLNSYEVELWGGSGALFYVK